ncbi:MAG: N-acetylneuraminate synthase family protein [Rhodospirillales bacterium]|nr:N-acetylneuraminate synthase family protein [Rhodospirillales bacterium]
MSAIKIGDKTIGAGHPVFVIAEIGFNHEGDPELGVEMVRRAAACGADAVKFQTFRTEELTLKNSDHFDLIKHGELDPEGHRKVAAAAKEAGVTFLSTPFSAWAVDLLEEISVPAYKVASMDVTNLPLIAKVAATGKPVLLSTGMATVAEIAEAVEIIQGVGKDNLVLLHCISHYPLQPENANLHTIGRLAEAFDLPVGFSDHSLGTNLVLAAVALGACVVEKHFTTDRTLPGPDHVHSSDPEELSALVAGVRAVEASLGRPLLDENRSDRGNAKSARRGLYAAMDVEAGTSLEAGHIKCVRPEEGLAPRFENLIVGRPVKTALEEESPIAFETI